MKKLFLTLVVAFATVCGFAQESISVEYPYYETINTRVFDISKVVANKEATVLEVYFYAVDNITVDADAVLVGNTAGKRYKLLRSEGVEIGQATNLPESGFMKGVLHFEPLDKEDLSFDFDGGKSGWNLKGVSLKEYSLKEVIGKDKKWGKMTQSPFIGNYVHDSIRVECEIKNSNEPVVLFNTYGFEDRDCEFTDDFTYTFPVFNATCFYLKVGRKAYPVLAWPGDTVKVIYDGNNSVPEIMVSDTVLQKSIMEYYSYDRSNGIYDSPVSYNLSPLSLFYKYTEGTLKRHLIRLQKYIEEHPGFDERAAYFYRTNIKAEQLEAMWSMLRRRKLEEAPEDYMVIGPNKVTALPMQVPISYQEIAHCMDKSIAKIESAILQALEATPSELYADIVKRGIYLTGGGALLHGLSKRLTDKITIPFHVAEDPLHAVARGTGVALKNVHNFGFLIR